MAEHEPSVRRLCVAVAPGVPGLLTWIQRAEGLYRVYLMPDPAEGVEFACAAPGLDEMFLVTDLIAAMCRQVLTVTGLRRPIFAGFHVGITKVVGDGLGGAGVDRTLALIRDPAIKAASERDGPPALLAVAITAALFDELRGEGLDGDGWQSVSGANAWLRVFESDQDSVLN